MIGFFKKILAAAAFVSLAAQSGQAAADQAKPAQKGPEQEVVLRVDGKEFTRENVKNAVDSLLPIMSYHSSVSKERYKTVEKTAIDQLINRELIYKAAKGAKTVDISSKDIDAEVDKVKKKVQKGQTLEKILKDSNMTMADLREDMKRKLIIDRYTEKKNEEFKKKSSDTVTEAYLKDYYQKSLDKFKEPEQIHLRSILIKADPSGGQKVWNEAQKKAKDIANSARKGEDFAKLAQKISEDPNAKNGGDMGWAHKGSLFPEIDDAAAKMNVGDISDPIMTIYGYHVIKLEGRKPSVQKKFDELNKEKLKSELGAKEHKKLWEDWVKELRAPAKIEYLADDIKPDAKAEAK